MSWAPNESVHGRRKQVDQSLHRVHRITHLMDEAFRLPGTQFRFGYDSLVGLVPGVGDAVTAGVSAWTLIHARRMGAPWGLVIRMGANIGVDFLVGLIPVLGDAADFFFKANRMNLRLLRRWLEKEKAKTGG